MATRGQGIKTTRELVPDLEGSCVPCPRLLAPAAQELLSHLPVERCQQRLPALPRLQGFSLHSTIHPADVLPPAIPI